MSANEIPAGWLDEGLAMADAAAEDAAAHGTVVRWVDARWAAAVEPRRGVRLIEKREFAGGEADADLWLIIAPETDGCLRRMAERFRGSRRRVVAPDDDFIRIASSKRRTDVWLRESGIPAVESLGRDSRYAGPVVSKPDDGCGGDGLRRHANLRDVGDDAWNAGRTVQRRIDGPTASAAVVSGPGRRCCTPPMRTIYRDGVFEGASLMEGPDAAALERLTRRVAPRVPPAAGWVGVDYIRDGDDADDWKVLEINPRMTTTYVSLRRTRPDPLWSVWFADRPMGGTGRWKGGAESPAGGAER